MSNRKNYFETIAIDLEGPHGRGRIIWVEVEFMAERPDSDRFGPDDEGDRKFVAARPFEYVRTPAGDVGTLRKYLNCSPWLAGYLQDCIDLYAIDVDWQDDEDAPISTNIAAE